jgi:hypothetical protein
MSLRKAIKIARQLGLDIWTPRRTGEICFRDRQHGTVRHNCRRDDASRALRLLLRRSWESKCHAYHGQAIGDGTLNPDSHPWRPADTDWGCPRCSIYS